MEWYILGYVSIGAMIYGATIENGKNAQFSSMIGFMLLWPFIIFTALGHMAFSAISSS